MLKQTKSKLSLVTIAILSTGLSGCLFQQARVPDERAPKTISSEQESVNVSETAETAPADRDEAEAAVDDVWERIRAGMILEGRDHPGVRPDLEWFARNQGYLDRIAERASPFMHLIMEEVEARGMPTEIALLPVVESAFQPFAYSHGRAAGLWQFIPGTGKRFGLRQTWWYDGRRDVAESTRAALEYLQFLNKEFDGDWLLALAAYNSGEGTVLRAIRKNEQKGLPTDFWNLDLPRETQGYVPKLLAISAIVADPDAHGVELEPISNAPFLTSVAVGSQIDLDLAAELCGISLEEIYLYNPGFNRWATDPEGPHRLLVPLDKAEQFEAGLAALEPSRRMQWARHKIGRGENLSQIAVKYGTTIALIQKVNGLKGHSLRAGNMLVIPVARADSSKYRLSEEQRLLTTQNKTRSGKKRDYEVRPGDTLWTISRRFNVTTQKLAAWNGMAPRDVLQPGRRLVIWEQGQSARTDEAKAIHTRLTPADFTHPHSNSMRRKIGYVVKQGDSLTRIAQRFKVSVKDLQSWNRLKGNKYLKPGQRLTVYVDVTRQSGNS